APLDFERLQRGPKLTTIRTVAVVQVIDERDNAAFFDSHSNPKRSDKGSPHRRVAQSLDQLTANPSLNISKFRDDFLHRTTPRGLSIKRGHATELTIEMTSSGRERTLPRHVRIGAQQFDTRALVFLQGWERRHLIHALHLPRLIVRNQLRPEI